MCRRVGLSTLGGNLAALQLLAFVFAAEPGVQLRLRQELGGSSLVCVCVYTCTYICILCTLFTVSHCPFMCPHSHL